MPYIILAGLPAWGVALIVIAAVLVFAILVIVILGIIAHHVAFGHRYDRDPMVTYLSAEDTGLKAEPIVVPSKPQSLRGYIYTAGEDTHPEKVIVFCHGLGPGHCAYMTEISYFCRLGYTVVAMDYCGCGETPGKKARGFYSGVIAAKDTVQYVRSDARFSKRRVFLVGHSWGAYSAICARGDGAVAISAPNSPSIVSVIAAQYMPKFLAACLKPVLCVIDLFTFGPKGITKCGKAARRGGIPMLLIQGELDKVVPLKASAYTAVPDIRAEKCLAAGKYHNPYNTCAAEAKLNELSKGEALKGDARKEFMESFDFMAAVEEDPAVMQKMADFLDRI